VIHEDVIIELHNLENYGKKVVCIASMQRPGMTPIPKNISGREDTQTTTSSHGYAILLFFAK
jgi:hypothetical protein